MYITQRFTTSQPPILESCPFASVLLDCVLEHSHTLHMRNRLIPIPHPPIPRHLQILKSQYEVLLGLGPFGIAYMHPFRTHFRTKNPPWRGKNRREMNWLVCCRIHYLPSDCRLHSPPHGNSSVTLVGGEQEGERRSLPFGPIGPKVPMSHGACSETA